MSEGPSPSGKRRGPVVDPTPQVDKSDKMNYGPNAMMRSIDMTVAVN